MHVLVCTHCDYTVTGSQNVKGMKCVKKDCAGKFVLASVVHIYRP